MRISGFTTVRPDMAGTRTYQNFMRFLGARPERLGIVSRLYEDYTATALTEALMNTVTLEKGKKGLKSINSFLVEWDLQVNKIERIPLVGTPVGTGVNASEVQFHFAKNYFQQNDIFVIEKTRQQFFVCNRPQRINDNDFLVIAKIQDNDYDSKVAEGLVAGDTARFMSNAFPELHEYGQHFLVVYRYQKGLTPLN